MLKQIYVHNFRCFENFEMSIGASTLLVGKNGAGKTTVGQALEILHRIARGTNRVGELVKPSDLTRGRADVPLRFEVEVRLGDRDYVYSLALDYPNGFRELRVSNEKLTVDGVSIFAREFAQVRLATTAGNSGATFRIDWHLVALPIIQEKSVDDPISILRRWLANVLILRPVPSSARGGSEQQTLHPDTQVTNVGEWFSGLLGTAPSAYSKISSYLCEAMPDFVEIKNPISGGETRKLSLHFSNGQGNAAFPIEELSDGEKCYVIFALTMAANSVNGPLLCLWDEPDNFLAPEEVGSAIMSLRRAFRDSGQLIVTSHNPETIRRFSDENTIVLFRRSHLEPTTARSVEAIRVSRGFEGGFVDALLRGDVAGLRGDVTG